MSSLSSPLLLLIFLACAAAIWMAGVKLSDATDVLSQRWQLGEALGGVLLLAIATNLPEIAITCRGTRPATRPAARINRPGTPRPRKPITPPAGGSAPAGRR
ncbi:MULTISPECIES: hypothetical protein [Nocardia]|uniref:hypothetical protein n=1 Tax=Nocardia TaxID=1817 RepID=UPI0007C754F1|nr:MULTISPECIES: hypothetical protein [Nocardia]